jgi:signal transduction histidine kinase
VDSEARATTKASPSPLRRLLWRRDPGPGFFAAGLLSVARLAAVAAAAIVQTAPEQASSVWLLGGLFTYTFVRAALRREHPALALADVALAALALLLARGFVGPYLVFALVSAVSAGVALGPLLGAACGALLGAAGAVPSIAGAVGSALSVRELTAIFALHPTIAALAGLWVRLAERDRPDTHLLIDTQRTLSALHSLARRLPHGLEPRNVAATALDELRTRTDVLAAAIVLEDGEGTSIAAKFGLQDPPGANGADAADVMRRLPPGEVHTGRIEGSQGTRGHILAVMPEGHRWKRADRRFMKDLVASTTLAMDNAVTFVRISQISADRERRRIARDLHDGVAQSVAHLRLELDLMRGQVGRGLSPAPDELGGLADLADWTLAEVRATIAGLRAVTESGGLAARLQEYVRTLEVISSVDIDLLVAGEGAHDADVESQVYRVAQEALSNALRHAGASRVECRLTLGPDRIVLAVLDDGRGIQPNAVPGLGIGAMEERASSIGASLTVRDRVTGGTRVEMTWSERREAR